MENKPGINNLFNIFEGMNAFGAGPGARTRSLLDNELITQDAIDKANRQSIGTGIVTGLASYLAQPKNKGYGSAVPYLAQSYLQANKAAQAPFQGVADQYLMDTQIAENKLKIENQKRTKELENQLLNDPRVKNNPVLRAAVFSNPEKVFEILNKPKPTSELKSFSQQDDLYSVNPDGTRELVRKGITKVDSKGLYSTQAIELANGDFAFLPSAKGIKQGYSAIGLNGKPYTKDTKPRGKGLTDSQAKSYMFANRMQTSSTVFDNLTNEKGELAYSPFFTASKRLLEKAWVVGDAIGGGMNLIASDNDQTASQSMRDFINAVLRNESGAAIADHEFVNAQAQYFPEVGDNAAVIKQKSENRNVAIATMKAAAGQDPKAMEEAEKLKLQLITKRNKPKNNNENTNKIIQKAFVGNRAIIPDPTGKFWIYEDTGKPYTK